VAAVGGVARGVTRRRFRRRLEKLEHQQAVEKERARIAKDIHDDLGASLTRITLLSQTVRSELDHPDQHEQAAEGLEQIYRTARDLTRAMDEIVWAVNPHHDTLDSLVSYLGGFAQDFLRAADLRCRLDVPMRLPALPVTSEVRHNLFLAFKEALHNLVRHAGATEARVVFTQTPGGFELSIQDNGRGFAATGVAQAQAASANGESLRRASGNGLPNMQKRLADLGGACRVRSRPGEGTVVSFLVPLEKAPAGRAGLS
jgi:signal transduction histidine kinase